MAIQTLKMLSAQTLCEHKINSMSTDFNEKRIQHFAFCIWSERHCSPFYCLLFYVIELSETAKCIQMMQCSLDETFGTRKHHDFFFVCCFFRFVCLVCAFFFLFRVQLVCHVVRGLMFQCKNDFHACNIHVKKKNSQQRIWFATYIRSLYRQNWKIAFIVLAFLCIRNWNKFQDKFR